MPLRFSVRTRLRLAPCRSPFFRLPGLLALVKATARCYIWDMSEEKQYTIDELTRMTGVSRRTVRFYVQRGLLPPPAGRGRGHHYCEEHLEGILRIQDLKREGKSLADIKQGEEAREELPDNPVFEELPRQLVTRICLAKEGVWLEVSRGVAAPTSAKLDRLAELCRRELGLGASGGRRPRLMVLSKMATLLVIPKAAEDGTSLRVSPGERVEIAEVTRALEDAEAKNLIEIVSS